MPEERFLVTGALGCIGAWTVRTLVREQVPVVAFDLGSDQSRLELIMTAEELERVTLLKGDVTDRSAIERALDEHGITHVIHLAALLIPLIKDDPPYGALVNVVGAVNVFEAVRLGIVDKAEARRLIGFGPTRGRAASLASGRGSARARPHPDSAIGADSHECRRARARRVAQCRKADPRFAR